MNNKNRINADDSFESAVVKLSEGNPGALAALLNACKASAEVDPYCAWGEYGPLFSCDTHGIYGSRIWMLFKDVCNQSVTDLLAALRAVQLGIRTEKQLNTAIDNEGTGWNCEEVLAAVKAELPNFAANS